MLIRAFQVQVRWRTHFWPRRTHAFKGQTRVGPDVHHIGDFVIVGSLGP